MLARLFVFVGGLIVLALTAALVGPYFVDWSSYRADFEREASAILGRKVTVQGEATAKLLPFPSVTFSDVSVGGGAERRTGDDRRDLLDGCRTRAVPERRFPHLRHAAGEAEGDDRCRRRRHRGLGDAPVGAVRRKPDIDREADRDGRPDHASATLPADGRTAFRRSTPRSRRNRWPVRGGSPARCASTACARRSRSPPAGSRRPAQCASGCRPSRRSTPSRSMPTAMSRFDNGAAQLCRRFQGAGAQDDAGGGKKSRRPEDGPGYRINGKFTLDHKRLAFDEFLFETGPLDNPYSAEGKGFRRSGRGAALRAVDGRRAGALRRGDRR